MSHTAQIVSLTEFQSRRAVMEMRSRSTPRKFLWGFPGMTMVLGFQPAGSATPLRKQVANAPR